MKQSKFAFILPGDTASSSRLYDAISSGTVPIILSNHLLEVGLPFIDRVPWKDLVVFLGLHYTGISERFLKNKLMEVLLKLVKTENLEDQKHRERV